MLKDTKRYDILVLGASGNIGSYIINELVRVLSNTNSITKWDSLKDKSIKIAIAGRNSVKMNDLIKQVLKENPVYKDGIDCLVIDLNDLEDIAAITSQARLLINAIGPNSLLKKKVVEVCINTDTHYIDLTGEIGFIEECFCEFNSEAKEKDLIVLNNCGFNSIPADLGNILLKKHLKLKKLEPIRIDIYIKPGISSYKEMLNYTPFQTVRGSISLKTSSYKKFRELLPRPENLIKQSLRPKLLSFNETLQSYITPFSKVNERVIEITQRLIYKENQKYYPKYNKSILELAACNVQSYFQFKDSLQTRLAIFNFVIVAKLLKLSFGKVSLLNYPHAFVLGLFQPLEANMPSKEIILNDSFKMTFISKSKDQESNFEVETKAEFTGPEAGYNFTSKSVIFAALSILKEKVYDKSLKLNGVLTPGLALAHTSFIERLNAYDPSVKFTIHD